ncbi:hypothetical protein ACFFLM_21350 [Deinococcus oregonensis]|uniref:Uncharacterized protein n=1 Tax=Deinococcus oregonensis TaxID=1805970 RepID=A0ABV6B5N1_9DEIO
MQICALFVYSVRYRKGLFDGQQLPAFSATLAAVDEHAGGRTGDRPVRAAAVSGFVATSGAVAAQIVDLDGPGEGVHGAD